MEAWWIHPLKRHDYGLPIQDYFRTSFSLGKKAAWLSNSTITVQIQGGTSPYRTGFSALDQSPWLISFGVNLPETEQHHWSIAMVENITQESTQDFGFLIRYELQR